MYKCCLQFNNIATIIFRQNVRYFATERDDGRYVNISATGREEGRYVIFLQLDGTTIGLSQEKIAQVSKPFRWNENVPSNMTWTQLLKRLLKDNVNEC